MSYVLVEWLVAVVDICVFAWENREQYLRIVED